MSAATIETGEIPAAELYRGVPIHDGQPRDRIERAVKPEIDRVIAMGDLVELVDYAADVSHSPEARLLAGAKAEAILAGYGEDRQKRPRGFSIEYVQAITAGLNSVTWRSPTHYGTLLDGTGAVRRETSSFEASEGRSPSDFADPRTGTVRKQP